MEYFVKATTIRLRSHNYRYLTSASDEISVTHKRDSTARATRWSVEIVGDSPGFIRLRSCVDRLLTASGKRFLLGATGRKVLQTNRNPNNASVEWEPLIDEETGRVMLRSRRGSFLRCNGGAVWPYKGSITHDVPQISYTHSWVLWEVEILEPKPFWTRTIMPTASASAPTLSPPILVSSPVEWDPSSSSLSPGHLVNKEEEDEEDEEDQSCDLINFGRTIHYQVVDDEGKVDDRYPEGNIFFGGLSVMELTRRIEEKTGIRDAILCVGIPDHLKFNKLHPMWLTLPPNRTNMTVFVVQSSSLISDGDAIR